MTTPTQPLRDEHKDLLPEVQRLRTAAEAVGTLAPEALREHVDGAYAFLTEHLIPHAQAEEAALYPVVGRVMGAPEATATMSRDHVEVGRLVEELRDLRREMSGGTVDPTLARGLQRVLYGLFALVSVHFAKEEEVYLPLLDARLSPEEAGAMFEAMEKAAGEAKAALGH